MLRTPKKADLADVIVYVHDSSDTNSFSYISNLRVSLLDQTIVFWSLDSTILATIQSRSYTNPVCCYKVRSWSCTTSQCLISLRDNGDIDIFGIAAWSTARCLLPALRHSSSGLSQCKDWTDSWCFPCHLQRCNAPVRFATCERWGRDANNVRVRRNAAIPGGIDRAMTAAARLRVYFTMTALLGGFSAGLVMLYRTLIRPGGGNFTSWNTYWAAWLFGRREGL